LTKRTNYCYQITAIDQTLLTKYTSTQDTGYSLSTQDTQVKYSVNKYTVYKNKVGIYSAKNCSVLKY